MIGAWNLSFFFGILITTQTGIGVAYYNFIFVCFIFLLVLASNIKNIFIQKIFFSVSAFSWAFMHNAPDYTSQFKFVNFKNINLWNEFTTSGKRLIKVENNFYQVYLSAKNGQAGSFYSIKQEGIFKQKKSFIKVTASQNAVNRETIFTKFANILKSNYQKKISHFDMRLQNWLKSISLGEKGKIDKNLLENLKNLNGIHLIVVSGMHIGFFYQIIFLLMISPVRILSVLRLLPINSLINIESLLVVFATIATLIYGVLTEFPVSVQRAVIVHCMLRMVLIFYGKTSLQNRIKLFFTIQTLIFPICFFNDSFILSWGSYLIILLFSEGKKKSFRESSKNYVLSQYFLSVLIFIKFKQISLFSMFSNFILIPLFGFVYITAIIPLFGLNYENSNIKSLVIWINETFFELIENLDKLENRFPYLTVTSLNSREIYRYILMFCMTCVILKLFIKKPIEL